MLLEQVNLKDIFVMELFGASALPKGKCPEMKFWNDKHWDAEGSEKCTVLFPTKYAASSTLNEINLYLEI